MRGNLLYLAFTILGLLLMSWGRRPVWRRAALALSVGLLGFLRLELPSPHCIVEGLLARQSIDFLKASMMLKLAIVFLPTLVWGRVFCGWVCPKGALQELLFVRRCRLRPPRWADRVLRQLPYASLAAVAALAVAFDYRLWTQADPFLWTFQLHGHVPGLVLLAIVIPVSVFLLRPFCRYLCPLVPIFRLLSLRPLERRSVDREACAGCSAGIRACSFDAIGLATQPKRCLHDATECLGCCDCRQACPKGAIR